MVKDYINKLYAGFLGKNVGIRLGAPVEPAPWDFDRIASVYGDITEYIKRYRNFAADDDINGPVYFLRGLIDSGVKSEMSSGLVARAWLNYARNGIGMFWWGGEGISTCHTTYLNLKKGIPAPLSGSMETNGKVLSEQIGGQIFVDTWGFIWPGNPEKAAEYAMKAAHVSHDGNAVYGGGFIAACIAQAFTAETIDEIIDAGLRQIPEDCTYAQVVNAVRDFYRKNPDDFRSCMRYLIDNWGYDKYPGACHVIPNAGVCVLALLYGKDFNRTVEIATMCGWDTDCNAGSVGSIAGVFYGLDNIKKAYRDPINDVIITSGISGYLNIMDVPTYVKDLAQIAYMLADEKMPEEIKRPNDGDILFDFELPGSTHGIRLSNEIRFMKRHSYEKAYSGKGSLEIIVDRILHADQCRVYYKPFYRRADFDDERYKPVFSPTVFSGQKASFKLFYEVWLEGAVHVIPYIRTAMRDTFIEIEEIELKAGEWNSIDFTIPDTGGDQIAELGFKILTPAETANRVFGRLFLDDFTVTGEARYSIDMSLQACEFAQVTPFSLNQCKGEIIDGKLVVTSEQECQVYTGNFYARDTIVEADITPLSGENKGLIVRGKGAECAYLLGFGKQGEVVISLKNFGTRVLAKAGYNWRIGSTYQLKASAIGNKLTLAVNDEEVLSVEDSTFEYGMTGFYQEEAGSFSTGRMNVWTGESKGIDRIK
ncbi:MAG: ADP-ribosylglycohydrolase family protein [Clostridiales bacterium]|jgi:ADP-ribosylglycohydrolase|nr:ADP-ribosylglycohydrolase family protein [Clostridiales bacterium]